MPSREILLELERVIERGLPCACCTVVVTRGSTPQKAGATMLVFPDGSQAGTLGGGCVEAEVKRRTLHALSENQNVPSFHTFLLDDDYGWDDGLICGGRMTILAEPMSQESAFYFRNLRELVEAGAGFTEAIALPENKPGFAAGARLLYDGNGCAIAGLRAKYDRLPIPTEGFALLKTQARIRLLIVGGGHIGQAVARLAAEVDFEIWILDDRESTVSPERFPNAVRRIVGDIGRTLQSLAAEITPNTYGLIVTRGHNHDEEALYHLARTQAGYVGMIGSKRKVHLIFDDLRAKGVSEEQLARVRAPVGLAIGSQSVPEIAISIVAELIACRNCGTNV